MKLEHLIQAYNFNKIPAKIKEKMSEDTGVITYTKDEDINASYLLDDEGFVTAIIVFSNCIVKENRTISNQLNHSTNTLIVIQKTIELLGNTKQEEANKILKSLGLFSKKIVKKAVKFLNYVYEVDVIEGILKFSVVEDTNQFKNKRKSPPLKSEKK